MAASAQALIPFEKDRPLQPGDRAFLGSIYDEPAGQVDRSELLGNVPQIVCSPAKSGKTTFLNQLQSDQESLASTGGQATLPVEIRVENEGYSDCNLRDEVSFRLQSDLSITFLDAIKTSRIAKRGARIILRVVSTDNLSDAALDWLLRGVWALMEDPRAAREYQVQVILDGSFALDMMTGPKSRFPMPQKYPREFTRREQEGFVLSRLGEINLELSADSYVNLWQATEGDKYLTQALCLELVDKTTDGSVKRNFRHRQRIKPDLLRGCLDKYIRNAPARDPLGAAVARCFAELSNSSKIREFGLRDILKEIESGQWEALSPEVQRLAYRGGIIRREGIFPVRLRAPLVFRIFEELRGRVQQVRALMDESYNPEAILDRHRDAAKATYERIMEAVYAGTLRILHVGMGQKLKDSEVKVNVAAWGEAQYTGVWEVETDRSVKENDTVWCVLWAWDEDGAPPRRRSEVSAFKIG